MKEMNFYQHENGVRWANFTCLQELGLRHGISTRIGGRSRGELGTLNLSIKVDDSPEYLQFNRRNFFEAVGVRQDNVVSTGQVHGCHVAVVDPADAGKRLEATDALVTGTPGLGLLLFFADCVPLLFFDPVRKVIGLSHAGWRGTFQSIGPRTIAVMQHTFGTDPSDCVVGIGPSIGPDDYEVDRPVMDEIGNVWANTEAFSRRTGDEHWLLDLWEWNRRQLVEAGIRPGNIHISGISTMQQPEMFFSHRASLGKAGRFGVLVEL